MRKSAQVLPEFGRRNLTIRRLNRSSSIRIERKYFRRLRPVPCAPGQPTRSPRQRSAYSTNAHAQLQNSHSQFQPFERTGVAGLPRAGLGPAPGPRRRSIATSIRRRNVLISSLSAYSLLRLKRNEDFIIYFSLILNIRCRSPIELTKPLPTGPGSNSPI